MFQNMPLNFAMKTTFYNYAVNNFIKLTKFFEEAEEYALMNNQFFSA